MLDAVAIAEIAVKHRLDRIAAGIRHPVGAGIAYAHPVRAFQVYADPDRAQDGVLRKIAVHAFGTLQADGAVIGFHPLHDGAHHIALADGVVAEAAACAVILNYYKAGIALQGHVVEFRRFDFGQGFGILQIETGGGRPGVMALDDLDIDARALVDHAHAWRDGFGDAADAGDRTDDQAISGGGDFGAVPGGGVVMALGTVR